MDLVIEGSRGNNLAAIAMAEPLADLPEPSVAAARVAVYWRFEDELPGEARFLDNFAPGTQVTLPFYPSEDRRVILSLNSIASDGTREHSRIEDMREVFVLFQRETGAPSVEQVGAATQISLTLAIEDYSDFAVRRKVRLADNEAMTTGVVETIVEGNGARLPRLHTVTRPGSETSVRTYYVRVSHSSGAGLYGAESPALAVTFADSGGSGGTTGDGDEVEREYTIL